MVGLLSITSVRAPPSHKFHRNLEFGIIVSWEGIEDVHNVLVPATPYHHRLENGTSLTIQSTLKQTPDEEADVGMRYWRT